MLCVCICLHFVSNQNQVLELDKEKQRFLVTLRCSDLQMSSRFPYSDWSKSLLGEFESYLKERESVLENLSGTMCHRFPIFMISVFQGKLSAYFPGSCMAGTVSFLSHISCPSLLLGVRSEGQ